MNHDRPAPRLPSQVGTPDLGQLVYMQPAPLPRKQQSRNRGKLGSRSGTQKTNDDGGNIAPSSNLYNGILSNNSKAA
jgi:hypothetical protein